jgi:hypothetical protein
MNCHNKLQLILTQTNYTESEAIQKLNDHNDDEIEVIREYMGMKPTSQENKNKIKSKHVNQEIYRQIRKSFDTSMREYRQKHPMDMEQVVVNLRESEEREKEKMKDKNNER